MQATGTARPRAHRMTVGATTVAGGAVLAVVIGTALALFSGVGRPVTPVVTDPAGMQAWTERLEGYGDHLREVRMRNAWTGRLNGQAGALGLRGMSERASQAWTDRLNGLAEDDQVEGER